MGSDLPVVIVVITRGYAIARAAVAEDGDSVEDDIRIQWRAHFANELLDVDYFIVGEWLIPLPPASGGP